MPRKAKTLSAIEVRRLVKPGLHAVGEPDGLCLQVRPAVGDGVARSWILRTLVGGKRRSVGLGSFEDVTLAQARELAREMKLGIRQKGADPIAERQQARLARIRRQTTPTFDACRDEFLRAKTKEFANPKHAAQWLSTLETYASPHIGTLPVDAIELEHVLEVLVPIWNAKPETASRVRGRIESVLAYARAKKHRHGDNPARWRGGLDAVLPKPAKVKTVKHHAAMPFAQLPEFWPQLAAREGTAARALQFAILTACRSGEVRGAKWAEIDLEAAVWIIPAARMKAGKEHRVPLSPPALALLQGLPRVNDLVFPAPRGGEMSDATMAAVLKRMERPEITVHGFRSTFRDWAGETTNFERETIEHALAHQLKNKAEAAYARGTLMAKRKALMQAWADFATGKAPASNVVPLRGAK
ncbi:MAG: integrase arm-type DNA-binding domain-containing protein [Hyphomonas sp.]|jgi:integrase|nr:integrase arm-type DNA-binding domain-containing protein [Hyphomonas sp.]